ncbi:thioredoxin [Deltaproteobacteria bacterium]|nr:thioredoxin [Deltaproteobacteria bacterium]
MRRALAILAVLAALQAGAWLAWRALDHEPTTPFLTTVTSGIAPAAAPPNGLLHVWATWCGPCRDELPGLLKAAREAGVPVVAVSIDENQASVAEFFAGDVPASVVRDPGIAAATGARNLPVTFRVENGRLVERIDGAREWSSLPAEVWLRRVGASP